MSVKTIKEMLAEVNYKHDPEYIPTPFAMKIVNFVKLMTDGKGEASPTPVMHYRMLDKLPYPSSNMPYQRVANLMHRGSSKTSVMAEILFFYIGVFNNIDNFGNVDAIIYVSDTVENGVRSLKKNMEARYYNSEFLQKYIPKATFNETEIYLTNIDGKRTGIRMFGASSGLRGTKIFAKRPQLCVMDDLLSDKNARSENILQLIKDTIYKGVDQALDPTQRKIIFNGTPFNENDPLYSAIESGAWISNVFPVCEKFPCPREDFHGSWEERFNYEFIENQYNSLKATGQINAFYQELMLEINSDESRAVEPEDINWYRDRDFLKNKYRYNYYITTDFAVTESNTADPSSISVWAIGERGDTLWVDGILEQQTMDKNIDDLFDLVIKYNPISVGIELNGQQGGFIPWIKQEMVSRGVFFTIAKGLNARGKPSTIGIRNTTSKLTRFNLMLPDIKAGKLWLPKEKENIPIIREALKQLYSVTVRGILSKHDDWLDSYTMLGSMQTIKPDSSSSIAITQHQDSNDPWYMDTQVDTNQILERYIV